MKRYIFLMFFLLLISCSNINRISTINNFEKNKIFKEVIKVQEEIIDLAKIDNKDEIKKRITTTLRNQIILLSLSKYDLSKFLIFFSKEIDIINTNTVKSILLLNYETETMYFDVIWKKYNDKWMIDSVE
ncbi:hypothetical protein [Streptobacillus moniliformis]|uniref:hypothetical protein n=1 Tax=Streptobacillus moniliformis TaxID=34105 RepID=UPI0007E3ADFC|nr:hypothetical protein [Streptobacillus moniliformis]